MTRILESPLAALKKPRENTVLPAPRSPERQIVNPFRAVAPKRPPKRSICVSDARLNWAAAVVEGFVARPRAPLPSAIRRRLLRRARIVALRLCATGLAVTSRYCGATALLCCTAERFHDSRLAQLASVV